MGQNVALCGNGSTLYSKDTHLTHQQHTPFENIVGKEEIARNEQFLLFPQCFLPNQIIIFPFVHIFDFISLFAAELGGSKIGICGKGLRSLATGTKFLRAANIVCIYKRLGGRKNNGSLVFCGV